MTAAEVITEVRRRGVVVKVSDGNLHLRPAKALTPELVEELREHKADILQVLEQAEHPLSCECIDCSAPAPKYAKPIESVGEVLQLARSILNPDGIDHGPPPPPPAPPGCDPMAHPNTDKAEFYRGVRERDLEKRKREGLPPWIRIIDGGAA